MFGLFIRWDCKASRTMNEYETAKCTLDAENDEKDVNRIINCSTMNTCFKDNDEGFDNSKCKPNEHCAEEF